MIDRLGSGMQALWLRQEVLANNLANVNTPGFKRDDILFKPEGTATPWTTATDSRSATVDPRVPVQWTDFSQGPIRQTGRSLDVALSGTGFLTVQTPDGPRYTRAGALDVSGGFLVLPGAGQVQGTAGPIALRSSQVSITSAGDVVEGGRTVGRLQIVDFPPATQLLKQGNGLFNPADPSAVPQPAPATTQVVGGALEDANVTAVGTLVGLIEVHRRFEAYQRMIQAVDETNRQATTDIGRV